VVELRVRAMRKESISGKHSSVVVKEGGCVRCCLLLEWCEWEMEGKERRGGRPCLRSGVDGDDPSGSDTPFGSCNGSPTFLGRHLGLFEYPSLYARTYPYMALMRGWIRLMLVQ